MRSTGPPASADATGRQTSRPCSLLSTDATRDHECHFSILFFLSILQFLNLWTHLLSFSYNCLLMFVQFCLLEFISICLFSGLLFSLGPHACLSVLLPCRFRFLCVRGIAWFTLRPVKLQCACSVIYNGPRGARWLLYITGGFFGYESSPIRGAGICSDS